ncbi:MAG TPA: hypothetical protein VK994_04180 [Bacteroidales bacterium]|nr:hypothetical protein [Bacteroidales bacterium]
MRALIIVIVMLVSICVVSCGEQESDDVYVKADSTYVIKYFVEADSAYIWYNVRCFSCSHYISKWDTSFSCSGGWNLNVMVTSFEGSCRTGILINGDTVDGCRCGNWCLMGFYLE